MGQKSRAINVHLGPDLKSRWTEHCARIGKTPGVAIKEAIELLLETAPHPQEYSQLSLQQKSTTNELKIRTQVLLTPSDKAAISASSRAKKCTQQDWISEAIQDYLKKDVEPETAPLKNETKPAQTDKHPKRINAPKSSIEDRLLLAMERLIERNKNFGSVTVEELSQEAGIARATFYLHFADKAELVTKLMYRLTEDIVGSAGVWFEEDLSPSPKEVDIRSTVAGIFKTFKKHHAILEAIAYTSKYDHNVAKLHKQMMDHLCAQSRHAILKNTGGEFPKGVSYDILADVLTRIIEMYCAQYISGYDAEHLEILIDTFTHICRQSIFSNTTETTL